MQYTAECLVSPLRFILGSKLYMMLPVHDAYLSNIDGLRALVNSIIKTKLADSALTSGDTKVSVIAPALAHSICLQRHRDLAFGSVLHTMCKCQARS